MRNANWRLWPYGLVLRNYSIMRTLAPRRQVLVMQATQHRPGAHRDALADPSTLSAAIWGS